MKNNGRKIDVLMGLAILYSAKAWDIVSIFLR
jgi:hypothetical protein